MKQKGEFFLFSFSDILLCAVGQLVHMLCKPLLAPVNVTAHCAFLCTCTHSHLHLAALFSIPREMID